MWCLNIINYKLVQLLHYKLVSKKVSKNLTLSRAYLHFLRENNCHCLLDGHRLVVWWQLIKMMPTQCSNDRSAKHVEGSSSEKWNHSELCECMQGFYKYHCNSMFNVSKAYFTDVNLSPTPSENSSLLWCPNLITNPFPFLYN